MNEPEFTVNHGVYRCEWISPVGVSFQLDHLHASTRDSELTAELTVRSTLKGFEGHIHQARLNLVSTAARKTLAKHLETRTPGRDLDWEGMVEVAAIRTLRAYRQGEPAILLRDAVRPPDAGMLLPPLVIGRLPTVWFGEAGGGKSLLALAAAVAIHTGAAVFGMPFPPTPRRVAYLDWEMGDWEHRERLRALTPDEMPDLLYVRCRGAIWDEIDRLRGIIAENNIGYVVIDSVGMACPGIPIESSEAALRFYDAVRALEVGTLCIAHKTKDGGEDMPFGSVYWYNGARLIWYLKGQQETGSPKLAIGCYNRKANLGLKAKALAFSVIFGESSISIERGSIEDTPELVADLPIRARIWAAVRDAFKTYGDLAEELDVPEVSIRSAIRRDGGRMFSKHEENGVVKIGRARRAD